MPAISSDKPYRIGRSKTGLGLFATKPIKKGTKIIRYFGPMLDCRKEKDDAIENKYLFQINGRWTIDGSVRKNIAPGEEINYDYGTEYFKEYLKPIGCKCDSCERKRAKQRAEARAAKTSTAKPAAKAKKAKAAKPAAKSKSKVAPVSSKSRAPKAASSRRAGAKSVKATKATPKKRARAA
jgi:hypothetical protein